MKTKSYPSCHSNVADNLSRLGFKFDRNRTGKDKNVAFLMSHVNGIDVEVPFEIMERYPELEPKINAVLAFYIEAVRNSCGQS
jgi:hypothetical protein